MTADPGTTLTAVLTELPQLRLRPSDWAAIEASLVAVDAGRAHPDELSQLVFEARIRSRFVGDRAAMAVAPTKQTSVLPLVGLICGGMLVAVGALLGGGTILVGIVALAVGVFGVAFAGSRVAHRGRGDGPGDDGDEVEVPLAAPEVVRSLVERLLGDGGPAPTVA